MSASIRYGSEIWFVDIRRLIICSGAYYIFGYSSQNTHNFGGCREPPHVATGTFNEATSTISSISFV